MPTVHLYVYDTLSDWEIGYAIAGINNPLWQAQPGKYQVRTVGTSLSPVVTIGGLRLLPDMTLADLRPAQSAMLMLPGGAGWESDAHQEALERARQFLEADVPVAAICGATEGLARAGMLDQVPHTSNAVEYLAETGYAGSALYQHAPAVTAGKLITASAVAPIEYAYQIFKLLGIYSTETLEAWHGLYTTGDPRYFSQLVQTQ